MIFDYTWIIPIYLIIGYALGIINTRMRESHKDFDEQIPSVIIFTVGWPIVVVVIFLLVVTKYLLTVEISKKEKKK